MTARDRRSGPRTPSDRPDPDEPPRRRRPPSGSGYGETRHGAGHRDDPYSGDRRRRGGYAATGGEPDAYGVRSTGAFGDEPGADAPVRPTAARNPWAQYPAGPPEDGPGDGYGYAPDDRGYDDGYGYEPDDQGAWEPDDRRQSRRSRRRAAAAGAGAGGAAGAGAQRPPARPRQAQAAHLAPRHDRRRLVALLLVGALLIGGAAAVQLVVLRDDDSPSDSAAEDDAPAGEAPAGEAPEGEAPAEPAGPASGFETPGLLTFRGSPTRSYYGEGPLPESPEVLWDYPGESGGMCSESSEGNETRVWCGTGWTGQPSVFEREGRTWVVFGAYDRNVHFVDYETGEDIIPPFPTGDIIKGSVSIDPDGFPLVYSGSRDNKLHVISIAGPQPVELWSLDAEAVSPTMWNDDWDGSPLVIDDYLYEGGENSQFHVVKLNRSYAPDGTVQVNPELVFNTPAWDDELLAALGDREVSVENSVAIHDGVVYFSNSGGLVQGWDVSGIAEGTEPTRVFRFWTGDDTDASVVIDDEGFLYVASEYERFTGRSGEVGQLMKLDPRNPEDPLVWSVHDPAATGGTTAGIWATPAIHGDLVIAPTNGGDVLGVDRATGEVRWQFQLPPPTWQSPVIVDDVLIQGDCNGVLHAYDVSDTTVQPPELWTVELGGCIESTPAVWNGRIFVGTRGGRFFAIGDR